MIFRLTLPILVSAALCAQAGAQDSHREILAAKFEAALEAAAWEAPGVLGISVLDLHGDRAFGVNENMDFPQGSSVKVALLLALYVRQAGGELNVDEQLRVGAADRTGGSGYLRYFGDGTSSLSLHDLSVMMIVESDNTATNMLIGRVGMNRVTETMADLGLDRIELRRKMIRPKESALGNENVATPFQAASLMARILACDLPISDADCRELQDILAIPHGGPVAEALPSGIRVLHKSGSIAGVRTSWAAVPLDGRPYALAVMGNFGDSEAMAATIRAVAQLSHAYFSRLAGATAFGTRVPVELLKNGSR